MIKPKHILTFLLCLLGLALYLPATTAQTAFFDCSPNPDLDALYTELNGLSDPLERAAVQVCIAQAQTALGTSESILEAQVNWERALVAYTQSNSTLEAGRTYFEVAELRYRRGLINEAKPFYENAITFSTRAEDYLNLGRSNVALGNLLIQQAQVDRAETVMLAAVTAYDETTSIDGQASARVGLADVFYAQGKFVDAETYFNQAIALDAAPDVLATAHLRLGGLARNTGNYPIAIEHFQTAEALYTELDDDINQVLASAEYANILRLQGNYDEALTLLTTAQRAGVPCAIERRVSLYRGDLAVDQTRFLDAITAYNAVLNATCETPDPLLDGYAHMGLGNAYAQSGTFVSANDNYQWALGAFDELNHHDARTDVRIKIAQLYRRAGRAAGVDFLFTAVDLAESLQDPQAMGEAAWTQALFEADSRLYDRALVNLQAAMGHFDSVDNLLWQAQTLDSIGNIYYRQGRYDEAIGFYEQALDAYDNAGNFNYEHRIEYARGLIYEQNGQFDLAVSFFERALAGFEASDDIQGGLQVALSLGDLFRRFGEYDRAKSLYQDVLTTANFNNLEEYRALALMNIGDIEMIQWEALIARRTIENPEQDATTLDRILTRYVTALDIYGQLEDLGGQAIAYNKVGEVAIRRPIPAQHGTAGFFQEALRIHRDTGNRLEEARTLVNLGDYYYRVSDFGTAMPYYTEALEITRQLDPVQAASIITRQSYIREQQGLTAQAIQGYEEALGLQSTLFASIGDASARLSFGTQSQNQLPYERMIRLHSGLNGYVVGPDADWRVAFRTAEQGRARSFLFELSSPQVDLGDGDDAVLVEEWQQLSTRVLSLNTTLLDINERSGGEQDTSELEAEIAELETRLQQIETDLELSAFSLLLNVDVADVETVQATLDADTAMVSYYILPYTANAVRTEGARVGIFVITPDSFTFHAQLINTYETEIVQPIQAYLRSPNNEAILERLHGTLIAPIADDIAGYSDLVIIPHDMLNYIPFEALIDGNSQPLIDQYAITYSPSATVYTLLKNATADADAATDPTPLIMSFGADLAAAEDEAAYIAGLVEGTPLSDDTATETAFRDMASNADIIHVAAHGVFLDDEPLRSHLALSADDTHDGFLEVSEIYSLSLQDHNPLVVLSACELAVSEVLPGDELEGMIRAFLFGGARSVVASLWRVDDQATYELMVAFYDNRATGMSDADALAAAKREIRSNPATSSPYFWAGFVLVGTGI